MDPNTRSLVMGAAGGAGAEKIYVEDVFSTYLYTGNGSTQTITNGIDLSGKGGLVWIKGRSFTDVHMLADTARGAGNRLSTSAATAPYGFDLNYLSSFTSTGFTLGSDSVVNTNAATHASWTFRKAAKFFDVVTYTGSLSNLDVSHNLGSTPGCIIIKRTNGNGNWFVWHRSTTDIFLNLNFAASGFQNEVGNVTASSFRVFQGASNTNLNASATYVAYLFAHDAGGFGDSGNESVIKCGAYTGTNANGNFVNLGWEPQFVLIKNASMSADWSIWDNMRGVNVSSSNDAGLYPNLIALESAPGNLIDFNATGFTLNSGSDLTNWLSGNTFIYIAIRRGPMKTPTDATKVFKALKRTGTGSTVTTAAGLTPDLAIINYLPGSGYDHFFHDRLRGQASLGSTTSGSEGTGTSFPKFDQMSGVQLLGAQYNSNGASMIDWYFRRAPGFFDIVAYTGTGITRQVTHGLGVEPELIIVKSRASSANWAVYSKYVATDAFSSRLYAMYLNSTAARADAPTVWNYAIPSNTTFSVATDSTVNASNTQYVAYLFASCPGVSKVGGYTGTGTTLSVDCGFTNGARFVLIKRTDSTGDWYVWDTARGIIAANDPYLLLNSTAAEVTSTDYIDPLSSGFQISSTAPAAINANGGSFVFLAIS